MPGTYHVSLARRVDGKVESLGESRTFETQALGHATLPASDRAELLDFQQRVARLQRAVLGAARAASQAREGIDHIKKALDTKPDAPAELAERVRDLENRLQDLQVELNGDRAIRRRNEPTPPSIVARVQRIVGGQWTSTSAPTQTNRDAYRYASSLFEPVLGELQSLIETDLEALHEGLESAEAPWTPGRVPRWKPE